VIVTQLSWCLRPYDIALLERGGQVGTSRRNHHWRNPMRRLLLAAACGLITVAALAGPVGAKTFGGAFVDDQVYRVFGNAANVPDGTGTDPFAIFTNSMATGQLGVAEFAPGSIGHHGGRWAIYRATFTDQGDPTELVTSWGELQELVLAGDVTLTRDPAADFRCPVLGSPEPIS
jgi:hypothetical protein